MASTVIRGWLVVAMAVGSAMMWVVGISGLAIEQASAATRGAVGVAARSLLDAP
ncbi:MAG: hypothetical protein ACSLFR_05265 [Solirubrobacteraceae bacterium]